MSEEERAIRKFGNNMICRRFRQQFEAFSLVEVTLALGIVSFAVLAIAGTLTSSMGVFTDARHGEMAAVVHRAVAAQLAGREFDDLPDDEETFRFDFEAVTVGNAADTIYKAVASRRDDALFGNNSLPPEAASTFRITVYHAPGDLSVQNRTPLQEVPLVVANREKSSQSE